MAFNDVPDDKPAQRCTTCGRRLTREEREADRDQCFACYRTQQE